MSPRDQYREGLRDAVREILTGREQVTLLAVERALPRSFADKLPSRTTLAAAVRHQGWTKLERPGSSPIFVRVQS